MSMLITSKIQADRVAEVQAAVETMLVALDAAQLEGLRHVSWLLPDGVTIVVLLQVADGMENPLGGLPEYQKLLEVVEGSRAEPADIQQVTVIGSYQSF